MMIFFSANALVVVPFGFVVRRSVTEFCPSQESPTSSLINRLCTCIAGHCYQFSRLCGYGR